MTQQLARAPQRLASNTTNKAGNGAQLAGQRPGKEQSKKALQTLPYMGMLPSTSAGWAGSTRLQFNFDMSTGEINQVCLKSTSWEWPVQEGRRRLEPPGIPTPIKGRASEHQSHSTPSTSTSKTYNNNSTMLYKKDGRVDPNGATAKEKRANMKPPAAKLFDTALRIYNLCRIKNDDFTRTKEQTAAMQLVKSKKRWNAIKPEFEKAVERDSFLSFDVENYLPNHADLEEKRKNGKQIEWYEEERLVYVILGTLRGLVAVLDMDRLHEAYRACGEEDPSTSIPKEVLKWLSDGRILVAGSGVKEDCEKLGIEANKLVDTRAVFREAMTNNVAGRPLVDIGYAAREGLGAQAFFTKQLDYKPMLKSKFEERYGASSVKSWPDCRRKVVLYKWRKNCGVLNEPAQFYLYHDGSSPASLVAAFILEKMLRGVLDPFKQVKLGDLAQDLLGPDFCSTEPQLVINLSQAEREEITPRETPCKRRSECAVEGSAAKVSKTVATQTQTSTEIQLVGKVATTLEGTAFAYFDNEMRRINMYKEHPRFPKACYYCGSSNHSRHDKRGKALCPRWKRDKGNVDRCSYERCNQPRQHYTMMCPLLHQLCITCQHRGHRPDEGCKDWGEREWQKSLKQFEAVAGRGFWTRNRHSEDRYGYWAHVAGTKYPRCNGYKRMVERAKAKSVYDADKKMGVRHDNGTFVSPAE